MLNHVLLHQTVIGLEAKKQLELAGDYPDVVIGAHGGGSNFAGLAFPFLADKAAGKEVRAVAVEPTASPSLTRGHVRVRFRRHRRHDAAAVDVHAGAPVRPAGHSRRRLAVPRRGAAGGPFYEQGVIEAKAVPQRAVFEAAVQFARTEGLLPAPESAHAVRAAIDEALLAKEEGKERTILFGLSGHGHFDLAAYDAYLAGELEDFELPQEAIDAALAHLPKAD